MGGIAPSEPHSLNFILKENATSRGERVPQSIEIQYILMPILKEIIAIL